LRGAPTAPRPIRGDQRTCILTHFYAETAAPTHYSDNIDWAPVIALKAGADAIIAQPVQVPVLAPDAYRGSVV